jgi:coenzyme F420-reducing hydrogenase alpha subunit
MFQNSRKMDKMDAKIAKLIAKEQEASLTEEMKKVSLYAKHPSIRCNVHTVIISSFEISSLNSSSIIG